MKAKEIVFLVINSIYSCLAIIFSFTKIFIEKTQLQYSIDIGTGLFELGNSAWAVFTKIFLIAILCLLVAMPILYAFARVKKDRKLWLALLICASVAIALLVLFIIFAHETCIDKSTLGFGRSTEYKFNSAMYVFIVFSGLTVLNMFWHCIDNVKKYR